MEQGATGAIRLWRSFSGRKREYPGLRKLIRNRSVKWALALLVPVLLITALAPLLPLAPPLQTNVKESLAAPSLMHLFGTDKLGRDVFSRTVEGIQVSLVVGFSVALLTVSIGMALGTLSGYYGGRADSVVMSVVDVFLAFPSLLLAIGLVAIMGAGTIPVVLAITVADLPRMIRLQRSMVLSLKSRPFLDAARTVSASNRWMMMKHVLPNTIAPMLVAGSITAANAILTEASLSFLGLGITPPAPSLGNIIREGQMYLQQGWWISTLPGLVILMIAIGLHMFSDGVRQVLDPKARS
ncbi:MAG TPA: ABC transporter permease [Paenibacillus sp.]|nr:ABC transporter permease [Paenibacillus sp.]